MQFICEVHFVLRRRFHPANQTVIHDIPPCRPVVHTEWQIPSVA